MRHCLYFTEKSRVEEMKTFRIIRCQRYIPHDDRMMREGHSSHGASSHAQALGSVSSNRRLGAIRVSPGQSGTAGEAKSSQRYAKDIRSYSFRVEWTVKIGTPSVEVKDRYGTSGRVGRAFHLLEYPEARRLHPSTSPIVLCSTSDHHGWPYFSLRASIRASRDTTFFAQEGLQHPSRSTTRHGSYRRGIHRVCQWSLQTGVCCARCPDRAEASGPSWTFPGHLGFLNNLFTTVVKSELSP